MGLMSTCGKVLLILVNTFFLLFGLLFLGVGIALKVGFRYVEDILEQFVGDLSKGNSNGGTTPIPVINLGPLVEDVAIAFIVIGCVITVIAILGMCGACCSSQWMLIAYATIVMLILLAQLALVIVIATGQFNEQIKGQIRQIITEDFGGIDDYTLKSITINFVQFSLQCCGVDGFKDYDMTTNWEKTYTYEDSSGQKQTITLKIPVTCCKTEFPDIKPKDETCYTDPNETNSNQDEGCFEKVSGYISEKYLVWVIVSLSVYLGIQAILVAFAIYLAVRLGKEKY